MAHKQPMIGDGHDLLNLIEIYSEVPVYIKIPIKNLVAPIHVAISYFSSEKKVIDSKVLNITAYASQYHHHPE